MKDFIQFYDQYLADIPGCTYFTAAVELRNAARDFCSGTKVWKVKLDPTITQANQTDYDFEITNDQEVVKIERAKLDGQWLYLMNQDEPWRGSRGIQGINGESFRLYPQPSANLSLVITAVLQPSLTARGVEDFIYDKYAREIAYGAKASLFMKPNQEWTNPGLADRFQAMFEDATGKARIAAARAYSSAPLRVRISPF